MEFVSFVTHTQMADQRLFRSQMETSTSIMLLVEREGQTRLMCIKSKPWDPVDSYRDRVILFSGVLPKADDIDQKFKLDEEKAKEERP